MQEIAECFAAGRRQRMAPPERRFRAKGKMAGVRLFSPFLTGFEKTAVNV
jgi:hypothetical protein